MSANVLKAIAVTAELTGTELSAPALRVMESDLSDYAENAVLHALDRCRKELTGRLTLAAIIERINDHEGRPTADEAWALSIDALDEVKTVVWTSEAQEAFSIARPILEQGDKVGARMAFRDAYDRIVRNNRDAGIGATWNASLGWDKDLRTAALKSAESKGLLPAPQVAALLPHIGAGAIGDAIFNGKALPTPEGGSSIDVSARLKEILKSMSEADRLKEKERADRLDVDRKAIAKRKQEIADQIDQAMRDREKA